MSLILTEHQQSLVLNAVRPLDRPQREALLDGLTHRIGDRSEIGDGELFRLLRDLQREHFQYPRMTGGPNHGPKQQNF
jgi:hypothetical protein